MSVRTGVGGGTRNGTSVGGIYRQSVEYTDESESAGEVAENEICAMLDICAIPCTTPVGPEEAGPTSPTMLFSSAGYGSSSSSGMPDLGAVFRHTN